jgi:nucleotide-binding universal stress UspA family protein
VGTVLVALQGSPRDDAVIDHEAVALARRLDAALVAVRVVPLTDPRVPRELGPLSYLGPHRLTREHADSRLAYVVDAGRQAGIQVETELIAAADVPQAIAEASRRHGADVVLVELPGDGLRARLHGRRLVRRLRRLADAQVFAVGGARPEGQNGV